VQIRAELGYFINTFGEQESVPVTYPATVNRSPLHYSDGFVLSAGIGF
jgi:hypothetical protein